MSRPRTSTSSPTCAQVIEPLRVGAWDAVGVSEGNDVGAADGGAVGAGTGTFDGIGVVGRGLGAGVVGAGVPHCDFGVGFGRIAGAGVGSQAGAGHGEAPYPVEELGASVDTEVLPVDVLLRGLDLKVGEA